MTRHEISALHGLGWSAALTPFRERALTGTVWKEWNRQRRSHGSIFKEIT